jgi:heme-degrading monooxygenase HmoA
MIVVLFNAERREEIDLEGYQALAKRMNELVREIPGFISVKKYVAADGEAVTIARFESEEALAEWRNHPEHLEAQKKGREEFYSSAWVQVCKTIREQEDKYV